jgi:hypothetical protein
VITNPNGVKMKYKMIYKSNGSQAQLSYLKVYDEKSYPMATGNFFSPTRNNFLLGGEILDVTNGNVPE